MDFLSQDAKPKVLRTTLYEDQEFSHFELEVIHTPLYQRLYELKQLGYSDRVFPDAVHSRFNHLLGVAEIAGRMVDRLGAWLKGHHGTNFRYSARDLDGRYLTKSISGEELARLVIERRSVVRLMALLHDLTHAAFGHTLEDEVSVFKEKHDDPERQIRFFDAITAQLITIWAVEHEIPNVDYLDLAALSAFRIDEAAIVKLSQALFNSSLSANQVKLLSLHLRELELAFKLLLCLEGAHLSADPDRRKSPETELQELTFGETANLLVTKLLAKNSKAGKAIDLTIHRDLFLVDVVGNTICADLIDYARRDTKNAGLKVSFDDRLMRYLCLVSVHGDLVPAGNVAIRVAMQVFTDKLRHDVLSEMSSLLKARYLISERITFHPTKCAAGACLGTAVQLIGLTDIPRWVQALGDQAFLGLLMRISEGLESFGRARLVSTTTSQSGSQPVLLRLDEGEVQMQVRSLWPADPDFQELLLSCVTALDQAGVPKEEACKRLIERAVASKRILWKLAARRYPKLAYRLHGTHSSGKNHTTVLAVEYNGAAQRFRLERDIERACVLPLGTVHIHCPLPTTSMKVAHALVVGDDLNKVTHLRGMTKIYSDASQLQPYEQEIRAIEDMYKSIWRMNIYIDAAYRHKCGVVAHFAETVLKLGNDPLLENEPDDDVDEVENEYDILAQRHGEYALVDLPEIIRELDQERAATRHRNGRAELYERVTLAISKVRKIGHNSH